MYRKKLATPRGKRKRVPGRECFALDLPDVERMLHSDARPAQDAAFISVVVMGRKYR